MATSNFNTINANGIYAISDTYLIKDENGNEVTMYKDEWDCENDVDCIRESGKRSGLFPYEETRWNNKMKGQSLCSSEETAHSFGNAENYLLDIQTECEIVMLNGHYSGANLDYDIKVSTERGDVEYLSDYDDIDDLACVLLSYMEDYIDWYGISVKWNKGTFKMQKNNIKNWLMGIFEKEIEKCEEFCKSNCEEELAVLERFSNGETIYTKLEKKISTPSSGC
jgi:hypothetical protein